MSSRRSFLYKLGAWSATSVFASSLLKPAWSRNLEGALRDAQHISPEELATEEDFWYYIQQSFTSAPGFINLNNAGVSPAPKTVQDAVKRYYDLCNEIPSFYMWRTLDIGREAMRRNLAIIGGCSTEEIAINRNATEGIETIIFGLQFKAGDEVVACKQDYPAMIAAWKQKEMREKIKINWVNLDMPSVDENYFVDQYVQAFTAKTKVVHITHMINWNGQILPVKKIAQEAHKRGIEVIVDGAQSYAHFKFNIPDLEADYFAASLHKWLSAPIGTGLLYVKKDKIKNIYPMFATSDDPLKDDIRKFEHQGTRPVYVEQAINKAIEFHDMVGIERKEKRLHYLKNYWMEKVKGHPKVQLHTSFDPKWACGIGAVSIKGRTEPREMENFLFGNYKIHTISSNWDNIHVLRISPGIYTTTKELDLLIEGINAYASK